MPAAQPRPRSVPPAGRAEGRRPSAGRLYAWRQVATREAYGAAPRRLGASDDRIVALDADVKNSTFSEKFEQQHPDRFYQSTSPSR